MCLIIDKDKINNKYYAFIKGKNVRAKHMITYTQEQLDIEVLKRTNISINQTLDRIERRLDSIDNNMKSQYHNFTNYILGIYVLILGAISAHIGGVF